MADGFEHMVAASRTFFAQLAQNNTKDWYADHKDHYTSEIKKPAELFGSLIAEDLARITGNAHKFKLFRIHRDVRFSKDKTPFNTHLHMLWSDPSGNALSPAWFFGLSQNYFMLGTGIMSLTGSDLNDYRAKIDRSGDTIQEALDTAITDADAQISDWGPAPLKRVPKPYSADHPHADLLRRKSLTMTTPIPENWAETGLTKAVTTRIKHLLPVAQALSSRD